MHWKSEKEFVDNFVDALQNRSKSTHIVREFRTGYGLPDIVWIEYSNDVIRKRKKRVRSRSLTPFTIDCAYTMAYLAQRRFVKLSTLKSALRSMNSRLGSIIEILIQRNLVIIKSDKITSRPKAEIFAIRNIQIIEAKLADWKRAIMQAQRFLWFTDNCYVLLPNFKSMKKRQVASLCMKYGVGLTFFSEDGTIFPVIRINKRRPYNTYLTWLLNENLFDELLNSDDRFQSENI